MSESSLCACGVASLQFGITSMIASPLIVHPCAIDAGAFSMLRSPVTRRGVPRAPGRRRCTGPRIRLSIARGACHRRGTRRSNGLLVPRLGSRSGFVHGHETKSCRGRSNLNSRGDSGRLYPVASASRTPVPRAYPMSFPRRRAPRLGCTRPRQPLRRQRSEGGSLDAFLHPSPPEASATSRRGARSPVLIGGLSEGDVTE